MSSRQAGICAACALIFLFYGCTTPQPVPVPETLPARLTDQEFWNMVADFSEPGGEFPSENFLSNESGYQRVIPALLKTVRPGGVYIGVGPEQNFTYIVALQPKVAFIVDIRRQNMLEHLFYKALMETSADRMEFLSRLFPRSRPLFETSMTRVIEFLKNEKAFGLSKEDEAGIRHVAEAFFKSGPSLAYTFIGGQGGHRRMPSYSDLMTENDGVSRNWNFLATDDQFREIQRMQKSNLIVPLVGDFAGPKTIRSVARYVQEHRSSVRVFYTSNVEQYLFEDRSWKRFYDNALYLPTDASSTFIRYVPDEWRLRDRVSLTARIDSFVSAYRAGWILAYYDVLNLSR